MTAYLDTNVLLDVFLTRPPWTLAARRLWRAIAAGECAGAVGASSLTDFFYVVRRGGRAARARRAVAICLDCLTVVSVGEPELRAALLLPGADLEDNLQLVCALRAAAAAMVTRDPRGFQGGPLPAETPAAFLRRLPAAP